MFRELGQSMRSVGKDALEFQKPYVLYVVKFGVLLLITLASASSK